MDAQLVCICQAEQSGGYGEGLNRVECPSILYSYAQVFCKHGYFVFVRQSNLDGGYVEGLNRIACTSALQSIAG